MENSCCHQEKRAVDFILWGSISIILLAVVGGFLAPQVAVLHDFAYAVIGFLRKMWWGVAIGTIFVGLMGKVPKEYFSKILGRGDTFGGLLRATLAGLLLDLCSHGILLVGAKLYERGASLAQVMAFLIASPWNSLSLTLILIGLIGLKWTLLYILGSAVIAMLTGLIYQSLTRRGVFQENPNTAELDENFNLKQDVRARLSAFKFDIKFIKDVVVGGFSEIGMLLRWLLLGVVIASAVQVFVPPDVFSHWFGPSLLGLLMTLIATTIIEVCSEGSAPVASEIVNGAGAPGNGFAFLMAGVSTDYTEMMVIREFSKSWWVALSLPLITVPQILFIGWLMNGLGL